MGGRAIDITGQVFGKFIVLERDTKATGKDAQWLCKCSCGNEQIFSIRGTRLRNGERTSCGCDRPPKKPSRFNDFTGKQFGHLTVLERDYEAQKTRSSSGKEVYWKCKCDCGNPNILSVRTDQLKPNRNNACGHCLEYELIGKKYGQLTVLEYVPNYKEKDQYGKYFKCQCDCNDKNIVIVRGTALKKGDTTSCGCYWKKVISNDLVGQVFGYLEVLEKTDKRNAGGGIIWHCKCLRDGVECDVSGGTLVSGNKQSCGCITSFGEAKIIDILQENNINFVKEKSFEDFVSEYGGRYRYDFYLPDYNRLIEFDGEQHYYYQNATTSWNTQENFEKTQQRDKIKNEYALSHNFELIRIPYWEKDNLSLEMLLGSEYLVSNPEF